MLGSKIANIRFTVAVSFCGEVGVFFSDERWGDKFAMFVEDANFIRVHRHKDGRIIYIPMRNVVQFELLEAPKKVKSGPKKSTGKKVPANKERT